MSEAIEKLLRRGIGDLEVYVPGRSIDEVKAEFGLDTVEKMAGNENPLGASPKAIEAARMALKSVHIYPDGHARDLKAALAGRHGLLPENFFVGNGADDVLQNIARAFVNEGDECIIPSPTFHPYTTVTEIMGGVPIVSPLRDFRIDLDDVRARITGRTKLIFLCNPNNPTGTCFRRDAFDSFLAGLSEPVVVVLDEAYLDFVEGHGAPRSESYIQEGKEVVVGVRTFSKVYGLAGFRVGYGIGRPAVIRALHKTKDPFNVSGPSLAAARGALEDEAFYRKTRETVHAGKQQLYTGLEERGLEYVPAEANFILVRLGPAASEQAARLMAEGVIVRPCGSFGLPEHIRVTVGTEEQNEKFLSALQTVMS